MEDIFKKQQKIKFRGDGTSNQNRMEERTINMVVTMTGAIFMHAALICHKDTLSTDLENGNRP